MKKLRVRQISESAFTVKGHGVHTMFVETVRALESRNDVSVSMNTRGNFDVTHIHTIGSYSLFYLIFGSGRKVVSAHVVPDSFVGSLVAAKYWLWAAKLYVRWFYNRADLVVAVSDQTKRELESLGVKRPIETVYNMIDTRAYGATSQQRANARAKLQLRDTDWAIIGAGQVQPRKRVDSLVDAVKGHDELTGIWVGGMPFGKAASDSSKMQTMINTAPSNMRFPGIVSLEEMKQYYWASNVFFLPSIQETFGLVVVEAAASGLPIILRDIPDYEETFSNYAIMVNDETTYTEIEKLRSDNSYYKKYQEKSAQLAARYDSRRIVEELVTIYKRLL